MFLFWDFFGGLTLAPGRVINSLFGREVPEGAMNKTIRALEEAKVLTIDADRKVVYPERA